MCLTPTLMARAIWEVDLDDLAARGIRGIILDLDNTIAYWRKGGVLPEARAWIEAARQRGMKLCLASNASRTSRVVRVAESLAVDHVGRATKPFASAYRRAMKVMGTSPSTTCGIGDQVLTDIVGANRAGLTSILVEPLSRRELPHTWLLRLIEKPMRRRWAGRGGLEKPGGKSTSQTE